VSTPHPACADLVLSGRAAMVMQGDFVLNEIASTSRFLRAGATGDHGWFRFPAVGSKSRPAENQPRPAGEPAAAAAGGRRRRRRHAPRHAAGQGAIRHLSTPHDAGRARARQGGFIGPHPGVGSADYPNAISRQLARQVTGGSRLVLDMSDQSPAAFGGTPGQGEPVDLQDWIGGPSPGSDAAVQARLECDAAAVYGQR
jgi:alpha-glucoside transport system substrate-binding protein